MHKQTEVPIAPPTISGTIWLPVLSVGLAALLAASLISAVALSLVTWHSLRRVRDLDAALIDSRRIVRECTISAERSAAKLEQIEGLLVLAKDRHKQGGVGGP